MMHPRHDALSPSLRFVPIAFALLALSASSLALTKPAPPRAIHTTPADAPAAGSTSAPPDPAPVPPAPKAPAPSAPSAAPQPPISSDRLAQSAVPNLAARLEALAPADPAAYFDLAEELASEARTPVERTLAQQLYLRALRSAQLSGRDADRPLIPGALRGLASLARLDKDRHWLEATARVLEATPGTGTPAPRSRLALLEPSDQTAFDLATALGLARAGEGIRAEKLLEKPAVARLLAVFGSVLNAEGDSGAANKVLQYVRAVPVCPECKNRRVVTRSDGPGTTARPRLCATCNGMPGPDLTEAELIAHLRTEAALLRGIHRFWSSQYLVDQGAPLRDPVPDAVPETLGLDADSMYWAGGQWRMSK
ncbi:hypothetical protein BH11PLA1_BH11PLA1_03860 [soil metagenome]